MCIINHVHDCRVLIVILIYLIVYILCKLIGGEFPVKHSSDYIGPLDKKAFSVSKPKLPRNLSMKVVLKVNVKIACQDILVALTKTASSSIHFKVVYSGIEISSHMKEFFSKYFTDLHFNEVFIDPVLINASELKSLCLPGLTMNGTLWLNTDSTLSANLYRVLLSKFQIRPCATPFGLVITQLSSNLLIALMAQNASVKYFSVLPLHQPMLKNIANSCDVLGEFLSVNSETLEYLQLRWYLLTSLPLESLQKCANLRVLSVTVNTNTPFAHHFKHFATAAELFKALQHLQQLEYFEWSEHLNLVTNELLLLYELLSKYLPNLQHWHWRLINLLLSTTDLENFKSLEELLRPLLEGKTGTPSCTTYKFSTNNVHFKCWLETVKPQTCFCNCPTLEGSHLQFSTLMVV